MASRKQNTIEVGERSGLVEPAAAPAAVSADNLGLALARSVGQTGATWSQGVSAFAGAFSLDAERLEAELTYLSVLTTRFAIEATLSGSLRTRVAEAFERAIEASPAIPLTASGLRARRREYHDAFSRPHPELGRAYSIGRTFARQCNASHEIAVIEFGARAYIERLPGLVTLLREVTVV